MAKTRKEKKAAAVRSLLSKIEKSGAKTVYVSGMAWNSLKAYTAMNSNIENDAPYRSFMRHKLTKILHGKPEEGYFVNDKMKLILFEEEKVEEKAE